MATLLESAKIGEVIIRQLGGIAMSKYLSADASANCCKVADAMLAKLPAEMQKNDSPEREQVIRTMRAISIITAKDRGKIFDEDQLLTIKAALQKDKSESAQKVLGDILRAESLTPAK